VAQRAAEIMQRYNHKQIDTEHVLLALMEQPQGIVSQLLAFLKVDANALSERLDTILRTGPKGDIVAVRPGQVSITSRVARILELANEHIFLEILSEHDTSAAGPLEEAGLTRDGVYDAIQQMRHE
jgi:ATP-dependent Clp protease ATP-binding subunit ClpC